VKKMSEKKAKNGILKFWNTLLLIAIFENFGI
jgi:hypothetical protein